MSFRQNSEVSTSQAPVQNDATNPAPQTVARAAHTDDAEITRATNSSATNSSATNSQIVINKDHLEKASHFGSTEVIDRNASHFLSRADETPSARRSVPKSFYAIAPSVLLLGLGLMARENASFSPFLSSSHTTSTRSSGLRIEGGHAILSASQTLVVPATAVALVAPAASSSANESSADAKSSVSVMWRARLQPVVDVVGRAPISGQITRVWVKPGQNVSTGDRILRIMSYDRSGDSVPLPRSSADSSAEREQVQAARAQGELGQRLTAAQSQLQAAQTRVKRAQSRVDEAMSIVRQLQSGARNDIEYSNDAEQAPAEASSSTPNPNAAADVQAAQAAAERAAQNAENARGEADVLARDAARAESEANDKTRRARELHQTRERELSKVAATKSAKTETSAAVSNSANANSASAPAPKASVQVEAPSVSSSAVAEADSAAREATSRAASLKSRAREANSAADKAQSRAQSASARAKDALRSLQLFSDEPRTQPRKRSTPQRSTTQRSTPRATKGNLPSLQEAARMVSEATSESRQASREAERWKIEVDDYSRQARRTQQRVVVSEKNLDSAQQQVQQQELDTTLQRNLSVVRAPAEGTVLQVGDVGDSVSFGDAIMQVGKQNVLRAQFRDTSGMWRKLKPGLSLPSMVTLQTDTTSSTRAAAKADSFQNANANANIVRVNARIEAIEEPAKGSTSAIVRTVVSAYFMAPPVTPTAVNNSVSDKNPQNEARRVRLRAGMTIVASLDARGAAAQSLQTEFAPGEIAVPPSAVVALDEENATQNNEDASAAKSRGWVAVLQPDSNGNFSIEWREVKWRNSEARNSEAPNFDSQIRDGQRTVFGLQSGERIALEAAPLRDLTLKYGSDAKVRLQAEDAVS